eukprot:TRINITY_DN16658_c3_g1_i1.p1 TRINITY_DN16658_c3_g1~~TRINITY_DN16658_c3_g1_i1.p1  ORF type:complete len:336 (+),score=51.54 TRINITY_DN16658_c3_g1_i1:102-1109(+)
MKRASGKQRPYPYFFNNRKPCKDRPVLHLIDASNWIFSSFHAIPGFMKNKEGVPVNAVMGFSRQLMKLMSELRIEKDMIAVAFDSGKTWRNSTCKQYKTGRSKPENLLIQMPLCRKAAETMLGEEHCLSAPGLEADDIIAEIARTRLENSDVVIHAKDQDFYQLVGEGVFVEKKHRQEVKRIGLDEVRAEFGLEPWQLLEYWALTGQSADMISGVKGVGPLRAKNLLMAVGSLDAVWAPEFRSVVEETCGEKATQTLLTKEAKKAADLGRRLMKLPSDEPHSWPVPKPEQLVYQGPRIATGRKFFADTGLMSAGKTFDKLFTKYNEKNTKKTQKI